MCAAAMVQEEGEVVGECVRDGEEGRGSKKSCTHEGSEPGAQQRQGCVDVCVKALRMCDCEVH